MSTVDEVLGVLERSGADDEVGLLVLAALDGPEALEAALSGDASPTPAEQTSEQGSEVENIYLSAIEATGFRGIGPTSRLRACRDSGFHECFIRATLMPTSAVDDCGSNSIERL